MNLTRRWIPAAILSAQALLIAIGAAAHSPTMDEIAHLAAGVSNWELGRFDLYRVNPPLVRMLSALPVIAAGAKTDYRNYELGAERRAEFMVMHDFTRANGHRVVLLVRFARWALIPLVILGGYVTYLWARDLYGNGAGILALMLWCFCPNVLAYAQLLTADAGAAALGTAAGFCFWKWLRCPVWERALVAGTLLGLAELTKTTWIILFPLWPVLWAAWKATAKPANGPQIKRTGCGIWTTARALIPEVTQLAAILTTALVCVNVGYAFEYSGTKLKDYHFVSTPLTCISSDLGSLQRSNRFAPSWLGQIPVPLPRSYIEGIDMQWHDLEIGKPSYLRGHWRPRGWWYWYFYAIAVKTPVGVLGLFLLTVGARAAACASNSVVSVSGREVQKTGAFGPEACMCNCGWRAELVLLAPPVLLLTVVSSQTGFSRYMRYVIPAFPFLFIWLSSLARFIDWRRLASCVWVRSAAVMSTSSAANNDATIKSRRDESAHCSAVGMAAVLLLAWSIGGSVWCAPHWLSYFNEIAGGPMRGPEHLVDAQVDWGQDLLYLKTWVDAQLDGRPIGLVYFGPLNPDVVDIDFILPPKGNPVGNDRGQIADVPRHLKPGWYAISVNFLYGYPHYVHEPRGGREWANLPYYSYFRRFRPAATAGYSIYVYHLTAEDISAAMNRLGS